MRSVLASVLVIAALGAGPVLGAGCAKSPTVLLTRVVVDDGVPPLLLLYATVVSTGDPGQRAMDSFVSLATGDAADRPAPYQFPLDLPVQVPVELAGPVTVTIEGRDWDRNVVVTACGSAQASVVKEQQTSAMVTLTAVSVSEPDGGLGGDGGGDAHPAALDAPTDNGAGDGD